MAGTYQNAFPVRHIVTGYSNAAVTANQFLTEWVCPLNGARIGAIVGYAATDGTGAGSTTIAILKNGASIFAAAGDRPTIAQGSTGEMTNIPPSTRAMQKGDRLTIQVAAIPATTGHARVSVSVVIELA